MGSGNCSLIKGIGHWRGFQDGPLQALSGEFTPVLPTRTPPVTGGLHWGKLLYDFRVLDDDRIDVAGSEVPV